MDPHHLIDPRVASIACDANALNYTGRDYDRLIDRFRELAAAGRLTAVMAAGVRKEVENPRTPRQVQEAIRPEISLQTTRLTLSQQDRRFKLRIILQGNAAPGKHAADAIHLAEAAETGCAYFITNDRRILRKRSELARVLPPTLAIVDLQEFFDILDDFEASER